MWSSLSHMALGLGEAGITGIPPDSPVISGLQQGLSQPGMYFFPYEKDMTKAEVALLSKPRGVMFYTPHTKPFSFPANLAIQFLSSVVCGWIAAYLIWTAGPLSFAKRATTVMLLAIFGVGLIHVPYWNWYGAPPLYVAAQLLDLSIGWLLAGLVIAWLAGKKSVEKSQFSARAA